VPDRTCPRCGATTEQEFYGPCARCREQLRSIETLPHPAATEHFVRVNRMDGSQAIDYFGPRVDDPRPGLREPVRRPPAGVSVADVLLDGTVASGEGAEPVADETADAPTAVQGAGRRLDEGARAGTHEGEGTDEVRQAIRGAREMLHKTPGAA